MPLRLRKFLYKVKTIYLFIFNFISKLIKYRKLIFNPKSTNTLTIFIESLNLSMNEAISFLKYKMIKSFDKNLLSIMIRKKAHHLEKILFYPIKNNKKNLIYNHKKLESLLELWNKHYIEDTEPIIWAKKILNDYTVHYPSGCPDCRFNDLKIKKFAYNISSEDLLKMMMSRRSRRHYAYEPLSSEIKELLIKAASYAPSSCNRQPLRYIFLEENSLKNLVAKCVPGGKTFFHNASAIIIVLADKRDYNFPKGRYTPYQDSAAAIQNLLLMAETLNLACCWGSLTSFGDINNEAKIREDLNIPEYLLITGAIAIGYRIHDVYEIPRENIKSLYYINKIKSTLKKDEQ